LKRHIERRHSSLEQIDNLIQLETETENETETETETSTVEGISPMKNINKNRNNLDESKSNKMDESQLYCCPMCDMTFNSRSSRYRHKVLSHPDHLEEKKSSSKVTEAYEESPEIAEIIEKKKSNSNENSIAKDVSDECSKLYNCPMCDMTFNSKSSRYRHKVLTHPELDHSNNSEEKKSNSKTTKIDNTQNAKKSHTKTNKIDIKKSHSEIAKVNNLISRKLHSKIVKGDNTVISRKFHSKLAKVECPICKVRISKKNMSRHTRSLHQASKDVDAHNRQQTKMKMKPLVERLIIKKSWTRKNTNK
jgi:uncharacterized C2H2 Zn-finger protein